MAGKRLAGTRHRRGILVFSAHDAAHGDYVLCSPIGIAGYTGMAVSIAHRSGAVVQGNAILNPASGSCCCVQLGRRNHAYSCTGEQKRRGWPIALWLARHLGIECIDVVDTRVWTSPRMAHDIWRNDAVSLRNISYPNYSCRLADIR